MNTTQQFIGISLMTAALMCACGDDGGGDEVADSTGTADTGGQVDEDAVVEAALRYADDFVQINVEDRASQHSVATSVNMWVPPEHADTYRSVDPDDAMATASFPEGTMVLKEHLDANGDYAGFNLMFKAPAGFNPDGGDWWWGRVDGANVLQDKGVVGFCIGCHMPRSGADWVYGVPTDNRAP